MNDQKTDQDGGGMSHKEHFTNCALGLLAGAVFLNMAYEGIHGRIVPSIACAIFFFLAARHFWFGYRAPPKEKNSDPTT